MKKKVNKFIDQDLAQNSEIFVTKKRKMKVGEQCRKRKKKSSFTVYRDGKNITTIALENINVG